MVRGKARAPRSAIPLRDRKAWLSLRSDHVALRAVPKPRGSPAHAPWSLPRQPLRHCGGRGFRPTPDACAGAAHRLSSRLPIWAPVSAFPAPRPRGSGVSVRAAGLRVGRGMPWPHSGLPASRHDGRGACARELPALRRGARRSRALLRPEVAVGGRSAQAAAWCVSDPALRPSRGPV